MDKKKKEAKTIKESEAIRLKFQEKIIAIFDEYDKDLKRELRATKKKIKNKLNGKSKRGKK